MSQADGLSRCRLSTDGQLSDPLSDSFETAKSNESLRFLISPKILPILEFSPP